MVQSEREKKNDGNCATTVTIDDGNANLDKDDDMRSVMHKICIFVQQRRPRLREFFHDGDELRHGCVSASRFRHCLSILGLDLNEQEWQLLEATFSVNVAVNEKMISYPAFIDAVEREMCSMTSWKTEKVNTASASSSPLSNTQNEKQSSSMPSKSLSQMLLASLPRVN